MKTSLLLPLLLDPVVHDNLLAPTGHRPQQIIGCLAVVDWPHVESPVLRGPPCRHPSCPCEIGPTTHTPAPSSKAARPIACPLCSSSIDRRSGSHRECLQSKESATPVPAPTGIGNRKAMGHVDDFSSRLPAKWLQGPLCKDGEDLAGNGACCDAGDTPCFECPRLEPCGCFACGTGWSEAACLCVARR